MAVPGWMHCILQNGIASATPRTRHPCLCPPLLPAAAVTVKPAPPAKPRVKSEPRRNLAAGSDVKRRAEGSSAPRPKKQRESESEGQPRKSDAAGNGSEVGV